VKRPISKKLFKVWLFTTREKNREFALAHALETDTVAQGNDHADAIVNLKAALQMELEHMGKSGVNCWRRAPAECWTRAEKEGVIVTVDL